MDCRTWKFADEWRPSKLLHYWERQEYREESWRLVETCCHSNSKERPSAKTDVKNNQGVNNNNDNNNNNNNNYLDPSWELKTKEHQKIIKEFKSEESIPPRKQYCYNCPKHLEESWGELRRLAVFQNPVKDAFVKNS